MKRWKSGTNSPTLINFDKILKDNEIEPPFFFDGKIESLVEYNKQVGEKMGFKIQIIFESNIMEKFLNYRTENLAPDKYTGKELLLVLLHMDGTYKAIRMERNL